MASPNRALMKTLLGEKMVDTELQRVNRLSIIATINKAKKKKKKKKKKKNQLSLLTHPSMLLVMPLQMPKRMVESTTLSLSPWPRLPPLRPLRPLPPSAALLRHLLVRPRSPRRLTGS